MLPHPHVVSSATASLPVSFPQADYFSKLSYLTVLCHLHRDEIREARALPRKYGCLNGWKKLHPDLLAKSDLTGVSKQDVKDACRLRREMVVELPDLQIQGMNINRYQVPFLSIKPASALHGFKVLHLSDIHLQKGDTWMEERLALLVKVVPTLGVQMIALTGDLAHSQAGDISKRSIGLLAQLRSLVPYAFFTRGNHDYDAGISVVDDAVREAGYKTLVEDTSVIDVGDQKLQVVGLDDPYHQIKCDPAFYNQSSLDLLTQDPELPTIVLTHSLDSLCDADYPLADLVLSGHTHGLLVKVPGSDLFLKYYFPEMHAEGAGSLLYNHNEQTGGWKALTPRTLSYVSGGFVDRHRSGVSRSHPLIYQAEATVVELQAFSGNF